MEKKKAIKLAILAIEDQIKKIAFDANMHERYGVDTPHAVNCYKKRLQLREAILVLSELENISFPNELRRRTT